MTSIALGTMVTIEGRFNKSRTKESVDPTVISFVIRPPSGADETFVFGADPEVIHDGVGVYHLEYEPTMAGLYICKIIGSGAVVVVNEISFSVHQTTIH